MKAAERFWALVDRCDSDECWEWQGAKDREGYGLYGKPTRRAHRTAYELLIGPIPEGLVIDHLCRKPGCVNPRHLEPVTQRENVMRSNGICARQARQTHCKRGHPLSGDNLDIAKDGHRRCRACMARSHRLAYQARKEARQVQPEDTE